VFGAAGVASGSCALGSVKTNIGHLDAAAGIAGLAKAVLALRDGVIPASLHFERGNPEIDFSQGPFYVCSALRDWPPGEPRRAGVSSFGIGGTNAHVVLEEAPPRRPPAPAPEWQLLTMSARSDSALAAVSRDLRGALMRLSDDDLPDAAYTLQAGRRRFAHRRALVVRDRADAIRRLGDDVHGGDGYLAEERESRPVVFMFPGTGVQHAGMAKALYDGEPVFREHLDHCAQLLAPTLDADVRQLIFGDPADRAARLDRTDEGQPCLFAVEYSLARLWMHWGITPAAMIGYSLGEYVAACLAGVFSLQDALRVVARRARLVQDGRPGSMLAVRLPQREVISRVREPLVVAGLIGPSLSIVSGPSPEIGAFEGALAAEHIATHRLHTSHAFHSPLMDGVIEPLDREVTRTTRHEPSIPFVSNVSGTWFSAADAADPTYWGRHLRQPVRFADGWTHLRAIPDSLFLEVGPGRSLTAMVRDTDAPAPVYPSLPHGSRDEADRAVMLASLGSLWLAGARIEWNRSDRGERRRRLPLPTYPFERQRYWIEPPAVAAPAAAAGTEHASAAEESDARQPRRGSRHPRPVLRTPLAEPATDVERVVAAIWEEVLGVSPVGVQDDFYELGGTSLMMTSIVARLEERFPVDVPLRRVLASATVAEVSQLLETLLAAKIGSLSEEEAGRLLAEIESSDEPLAH
jgi:acyl transferase domain-containing protein